MTLTKTLAALAITFGTASAAVADNVTAANPQSLMSFFESEGAPAKLVEDNVGDPKIELKHYSTDFSVYFYGCDSGKSCDAIQFFSGYATEGKVAIATINEWNTDRRFARAYLTDDGAARIEYDIYTGADGITTEDFAEIFEIWVDLLGNFEKHIDW